MFNIIDSCAADFRHTIDSPEGSKKSFHAKSREQNHAEPLAKSWTDVDPKCMSFNAKGIGTGVHEYRTDFGKGGGRQHAGDLSTRYFE